MDEVHRIFTVEEANELVPTLQLEFGRIARLRSELAPLIQALGGPDAATEILQDGAEVPANVEAEATRLKQIADGISAAMERVQALGCLVKDLDMGLVDFYSMRAGDPVFLCWQFGEPAVTHWHGLDEGYSDRRLIDGMEVEPPEYLN